MIVVGSLLAITVIATKSSKHVISNNNKKLLRKTNRLINEIKGLKENSAEIENIREYISNRSKYEFIPIDDFLKLLNSLKKENYIIDMNYSIDDVKVSNRYSIGEVDFIFSTIPISVSISSYNDELLISFIDQVINKSDGLLTLENFS